MDEFKILIVEDERLIAFDLKDKVSRLNYEVIDMAFTGEEAVSKTLSDKPNLILMDINLGKGMDGIEAASKIQQHVDIPVIYVTANADMSTVEKARSTEPYGYINKPVNIRDLYTSIDSALNKHRMKLQLHESEKKFRHIFDHAIDGICIINTSDRGIFLTNRMFARMTGYSSEELSGMTIDGIHPEDSREIVKEEVRKIIHHSTGVVKHIPVRRKDGSIFFADITASLITLGNNEYIMGIFRDITESKMYEDALRQSEERFRNIVQASPLGIHMYELDKAGNLVFSGANESADSILGVDNSIYIGKTIEEAFPPLAETEVPERYRLAASTGTPWRSEHIMYKDNMISGIFELYAFQTEQNKMVAQFMDVTEKRRAEEEIREKNEKLAALNIDLRTAIEEHETTNEQLLRAQVELIQREDFLQSIFRVVPAGIGTIKNGEIEWMNKMLTEMTGYSEEELMGSRMRILYRDDATYEAVEESLKKQILEEGRGSLETEWVRKDERKIHILFAATRVREMRKNEEITFTALDITERKHAYDRLIQSEKMMTVGGLAAGMAHEINNPLGIIMQGVQMIQNRIDLKSSVNRKAAEEVGLDMTKLYKYMERRKVLEYISNIRDAGVRAANIVSNMLQFSRKSETKVSGVDLNELVDRSIEIASKDYDLEKKYDFRSIKIIRKYGMSLKKISCIEMEIEQVILNLLKNSAQSMSEQNRQNAEPEIEIITRMEKSFVVVEVIDNGPGIEKEVLNRIFEPFYTTKKVGAGTGLGLSVSYFIITNNHSGSITADSVPGKGAKFTIKLPVNGVEGSRVVRKNDFRSHKIKKDFDI